MSAIDTGRVREVTVLELEGTELLVYDLPDDLVGGHCRGGAPPGL